MEKRNMKEKIKKETKIKEKNPQCEASRKFNKMEVKNVTSENKIKERRKVEKKIEKKMKKTDK